MESLGRISSPDRYTPSAAEIPDLGTGYLATLGGCQLEFKIKNLYFNYRNALSHHVRR